MQQILLGRRGRKQKNIPLLALSLRDLGYGIAPPEVLVKRSQDDLEVFWPYAQILNGDLANWVGSGNDAYISGIYNQATGYLCTPWNSGYDTLDLKSSAPRIVTNGVLEIENGKPIMRRYRGRDGFISDVNANISNAHYFGVIKNPANNAGNVSIIANSVGLGNTVVFFGVDGDQATDIHRGATVTEARENGVTSNYTTLDDVYNGFQNQTILSLKAEIFFSDFVGNSKISTALRANVRAFGNHGMVDTQEILLYGEYQDTLKIEQEQNDYYNAFNK